MNKKYLTILILLTLAILSACGSAPEPTLSAADVQSTAVALAWVAITQTQAAIPASTPAFPPTATFTPQPTLTALQLPTLSLPTAVVVATATSECNQVPSLKPQGVLINVEFKNESNGTANFSFGMNSPNAKGECVTYGFGLGKFDVIPTKVLAGCYWGYAWITGDTTTSTAQGTQLMCLTDPAVTYHVGIGKETIYLK
jgi:hypothetical protein